MPNLGPKPYQFKPNQELNAGVLNKLMALVDRSVRGESSVLVQDYGDRVTLTFNDTSPSLPATSNYLQQFVVLGELDDLLICCPFEFYRNNKLVYPQVYSAALDQDSIPIVYVAKPYILQRTPWDGQDIILGGFKSTSPLHSTTYAGNFTKYAVFYNVGIGQRQIYAASYYDTVGALSIPTEVGVTYLFECWGGGAGGSSTMGDGGGGGAYANYTLMAGGSSVTAFVGHGAASDGNGGDTWVASITTVNAGGGTGSSGGVPTAGSISFIGGNGGSGTTTLGGGGGGSATATHNGYAGEDAQDSNGTDIPFNGSGGMGYGLGGDASNPAGIAGNVAGGGGAGRSPSAAAGGGVSGRVRVTVVGGGTTQSITPNYQIGEVITAARSPTGYYAILPNATASTPVQWMDANLAGRTWQSGPILDGARITQFSLTAGTPTQSPMTNLTPYQMYLAALDYDTSGYFNPSNPQILTIPEDGYYEVGAELPVGVNAGGIGGPIQYFAGNIYFAVCVNYDGFFPITSTGVAAAGYRNFSTVIGGTAVLVCHASAVVRLNKGDQVSVVAEIEAFNPNDSTPGTGSISDVDFGGVLAQLWVRRVG